MKLIISFKGKQSQYSHGVELGRIINKMESGERIVDNNGFPVHLSNKNEILASCIYYGYTPIFGKEHYGEWIEFTGIMNSNLN